MKKYSIKVFFSSVLFLISFSAFTQPVQKITNVYASYIPYAGSNTYSDIGIIGLSGTYDYKFGSASGLWTTQMQRVNGFVTDAGECYNRVSTAHTVKIRRVDNAMVTGNTTVLWMEGDSIPGPGVKKINVRPVYEENMETAFSAGFYNWGTDNLFDNTMPGTNNNNIERFDVIIPAGFTILDKDAEGFTLFERGVSGAHDAIKVAGISGLNGAGDPNAYKALPLSIAAADWGDIPGSAIQHVVLRKEPGIHANLVATGIKKQDRGGIFIPFASLGFANGNKVYGYSLMAPDVVPATTAEIVNYNNNTVFPLTTQEPAGGIDLIGDVDIFRLDLLCALPVVFSYVKATRVSVGVQLQWQTLSEVNNARFEIEHSVTGVQYEKVGMLNAVEGFDGKANYSFVHGSPATGNNYYRIKQIDIDGKSTYTKVMIVEITANNQQGMTVFPNPLKAESAETIQIKLKGPGLYFIKLLDVYARVIASAMETTQNGVILFSPDKILPKGYYLVQAINANNGKMLSQPILIK